MAPNRNHVPLMLALLLFCILAVQHWQVSSLGLGVQTSRGNTFHHRLSNIKTHRSIDQYATSNLHRDNFQSLQRSPLQAKTLTDDFTSREWKVRLGLLAKSFTNMGSRLNPQQIFKKGKSKVANALVVLAMVLGSIFKSTPAFAGTNHQSSLPSLESIIGSPKSSLQLSNSKRTSKRASVEVVIADHSSASSSQQQKQHQEQQSSNRASAARSIFVEKRKQLTDFVKQSNLFKSSAQQELEREAVEEVERSWKSLADSLTGIKMDTLILLIVTGAVIPISKRLNTSPIIGFLLSGMVLGRTGLQWVQDEHLLHILGELGIVFFLFEMGLELSLDRLMAMRNDVFGVGSSQFVLTAALGAAVSKLCGLSTAAAVTIGGSLSLSSSAFVLQLLKDKDAMGTRVGKASFGILLLQDLAVVPLLVIVDILSKGGTGIGKALTIAGVKALVTLSSMSLVGKKILDPLFYYVARSSSQEAFLSIILSTVLLMSFVTEGIGLSNTLGAFLAGLLLAETKYRYQIEADIAPFRGLLLGVFFITVGFSIDVRMLLSDAPRIATMLFSLIVGKAAVITSLCMTMGGLSLSNALQCGLLNSQGGEFAFVALGIAEKAGLIPSLTCTRLMTTVALSMAATPMLFELGTFISNRLEQNMGAKHYLGLDSEGEAVKSDIEKNNFVFICGYGRVGKMVGDMLDRKFIRYVALDKSPARAVEARNKGLPVFYGDITRPEVLKSFDVGHAQACVIAIDDMKATNQLTKTLLKYYPDLPIIIRAKNLQHQKNLEAMSDNIYAMSPVLPDDSVLLTIPFGGVVLQKLGVSKPEIEAILEDSRRTYMEAKDLNDDSFDFLSSFKKRLPSPDDEDDDDGNQQDVCQEVDTEMLLNVEEGNSSDIGGDDPNSWRLKEISDEEAHVQKMVLALEKMSEEDSYIRSSEDGDEDNEPYDGI